MGEINSNLAAIFQDALTLTLKMQHDIMTVEHVFYAFLQDEKGNKLVTETGANIPNLLESLDSYLEEYIPKTTLPQDQQNYKGPQQTPAFARIFENMIEHAKRSGRTRLGAGDFLIALMQEEKSYSARLLYVQGVTLDEVVRIVVEFDEHREENTQAEANTDKLLDKYARNLNNLAIEGRIDPLIGRNQEIDQIAQVLCRRKKNNPMLLGEAGVGKSAVVEGLALRITLGDVPAKLQNSIIYSVDVSAVIAGTKYRGEFETRIKKILAEVEKNPNIIIFFDEIHMIVGAGQPQGSGMDFSNLLKPMLGNGRLRCIGATTPSDYKTSLDKDKALARRFTQIKINEPNEDECLQILQKIAPLYEEFHNVTYTQEALKSCVSLSSKYITEKHLPDKAIDLMDEAGAKVQLYACAEHNKSMQEDSISCQEKKALDEKTIESKKSKKRKKEKRAKERKIIDKDSIENLMSSITNIPKSTINADEGMLLKNLESELKKRIFSQDHAITKIAEKIKINKAGLGELERPIASFLFTGPSGVGKTELSKELAKLLGIKFERIDMSEYAESHSISKLIGSPSGYVGYEEGGLLINKIRTNPHCVLLLDELEKAHSDVYNILLQIMDSATLSDNQNNKADFKNVILIMTSNAGSKEGNSVGFLDTSINRANQAVKDTFSPEFRGRLDAIITFQALQSSDLEKIAQKHISDLNTSLKEKNIHIKLLPKAAEFVAQSAKETALGAREIKRIIDSSIKLPLSNEILFGPLRNGGNVQISVKKEKLVLDII